MPFTIINGTNYYYEEHGETGPTILFAHGFFGNHASWFRQVAHFRNTHRVIIYDQKGFGLTRWESGDGSASDDLTRLLDALGVEHAALVGHSLGGNVCLDFALAHPGRVDALVLADSLGGMTLPQNLQVVQEERSQSIKDLPPVRRLLSPDFVAQHPDQVELFFQTFSFNQASRPATSQAAPRRVVHLEDAAATLSTVPTLFLVGELDLVQPPDLVEAVCGQVPNATFVRIPNAGHSAYFEQPHDFNEQVASFLMRRASRVGS